MKTLIPFNWGEPAISSFFDDDFFPGFKNITAGFPRIDIEDKEKELIVTADLPGFDPKNIEIEAEEDKLILQGAMEMEKEEKKKNFFRQERRSGNIYREILLPCCIDQKKIKADFKNGSLKINLPKKESDKQKRIKVKL